MTLSRLVACGLPFLLTGCITAVGPDYDPPAPVAVSDEWRTAVARQLDDRAASLHAWWQSLEDPVLSQLIEQAHGRNRDLAGAVARIDEARALVTVATGARFPDIQGTGSATRSRTSKGVSELTAPPQRRTDTVSQLGLSASWEVDLWGRVRRSVESAEGALGASIEDLRDLLVVTYADVGSTYIQLRTLQERLRLARANVTLQRETLELVRARNRAELAPELDVRQAELNLAVTEAAVPTIEASIAQTQHQLGVLVGTPPTTLVTLLAEPAALPAVPEALVTRVPADVVRQRPDVRRAERLLAAQTAQIGVSKAALFPTFSLTGDFGAATASGRLLEGSNQSWSYGTGFSWNLFNFGRVRAAVRAEEAATREQLANYEQAVLFALQDVEDSLVSYVKEQERRQALERAVVAAQGADRLVRELYRRGLTNFQNVLDTQRSLFSEQDSLADSKGTVLLNLISVYRAFGGGWQALDESTIGGS